MGQEGPHCGAAGWAAPVPAGIGRSAAAALVRCVADASVRAADVKTASQASELSRGLRCPIQRGEES
jgi:hypothetical protein